MLDKFLVASYQGEQREAAAVKLASMMEGLPPETLLAIVRGKEKLACGGDDGTWLDKFRTTPLFQKAFALEKRELEIRVEEQKNRAARDAAMEQFPYDSFNSERDELGVQRKMLELELAAHEEGVGGEDPDAGLHGEQPGVQVEVAPAPEKPPAKPPAEVPPEVKAAQARFLKAASSLAVTKTAKRKEEGPYLPRAGAGVGKLVGSVTGGALGATAGHQLVRRAGGGELSGLAALIGGISGAGIGNHIGGRLGGAAGRGLDKALPPEHKEAQARFAKAAAALQTKQAFGMPGIGGAVSGLAGAAKSALPGIGKSLQQGAGRTMAAFQRGGLGSAARTAGRSAMTFASQHPMAAMGMGAGAAGLAAGYAAG